MRAGAVSLRPGVDRLLGELQERGIAQWIVTSSGAPSVSALLDTLFPVVLLLSQDLHPPGIREGVSQLQIEHPSRWACDQGLSEFRRRGGALFIQGERQF